MTLLRALAFAAIFPLCSCSADSSGQQQQPPPPSDASDEEQPDASPDAEADAEQQADTEPPEAWAPAPLRVVTWNVHDFYDNIAGNCGCKEEPTPKSSNEYQQKISSVAGVLSKLGADVVMLQEVENAGVLDKLAADPALASSQLQYRYLFPGNDPRGINIGFMSRYPVKSATSHQDDQFTREDKPAAVYRYTRDALEIRMDHRGKQLVFFGVHFKAKSDPDDPDKRLAEAQYTRKLADNALKNDPSAYVFILGDFNDTPASPPFMAVQNGNSGPQFDAVAGYAPVSDRYTYTYGGQKVLIDHLFASPSPAMRLDKSSVTITHSTLPSDHAPIAATFQVP